MAREYIVKLLASLPDGTFIVEHDDGRLERQKSETDWARVDSMTEEEIDASIADDPDWAEFKQVDWSKADIALPARKKPISIRIDEDVLQYFKGQGAGYQRRVNAVLRSYVEQMKSPRRAATKTKRRTG